MELGIILIILALFIAAYIDLNKREIPDWITYPLIVIGFLSSLFPATFINIIFAAVFFIIGYIAYNKKILGGGDVKLITGIILMLPAQYASIDFIITFLFLSCICALGYYVVAILLKKEKLNISATIPLAPCIMIGFIATLVGLI